ncbi:spore coat protein I [Anaerotignum neopropionicum]|uniref:Spore coat protein I n=1 Tax=Anaerotignum neopropionicum TaxID=36847 RepID=A0A136WHW4_9FIRM|nr:CotS family spore coat protein [Anaerotignum neopropionicum]KXL53970.1 spore coat protein I [Anaerotignum neopropionicum]
MEDIYEKILWEGYGLRFYSGTRTRTGLVCKTDKGLRELKKARERMNSIRYAHDVKECLYRNGFTVISRFYNAMDGQPCFVKDGTIYVLEELLPAASMEEEKEEAFIKGAETLGRMHFCAKGLESNFAQWDTGRLPAQFTKRRIELAKIKRRIQRQGGYDAIDLLVMEHYDTYMEHTQQAEALLQQADYPKLVEQAKKEGTFCHQSYKGENLRVGDDGRLYVGGFEGCSSDIPLLDLVAYLKRYMKKTNGSKAGVMQILEAYEKNNPLEEDEKILLQALAIYPEKFLRLINEYYNKRRACVSPAMQERLALAAEEEERTKDLLCFIQEVQP